MDNVLTVASTSTPNSLNLDLDYSKVSNGVAVNASNPGAGDVSLFLASKPPRAASINALLVQPKVINAEFAANAVAKSTNEISQRNRYVNTSKTVPGYVDAAIEYHSVGLVVDPATGKKVAMNTALFSRAGDFLLPLCVGPEQYLDRNPSGDRSQILQKRWMTFSESLALATGFYSPGDYTNLYYHYAFDDRYSSGSGGGGGSPASAVSLRGSGTTNAPPRTDRGHLVLDAWAPYYNPVASSSAHVPGNTTPIGTGVPLALGVLDQFRSVYGISSTGGNYVVRTTGAYGSDQQLIPGRLNLNTAPLTNLRTLPMLSPVDTVSGSGLLTTTPNPYAWDVTNPKSPTYLPLYNPTNETYDIAAALLAYRDNAVVQSRPTNRLPGPGTQHVIDFTRTTSSTNPGGLSLTRATNTWISDIRESPGFRSVGEILAVNMKNTMATDPTLIFAGKSADWDDSIFRFGSQNPLNKLSTTRIGIQEAGLIGTRHLAFDESTGLGQQVNLSPPTSTPTAARVANTYAQKIAIANAVSNVATVRSDVFIVYFIIQGYTQQDVQVQDGEPMIPSLKKRFVMVVDRSNVLNKGDKPRVLMLREVPVE